jgi:hypothetical protein
MRTEIGKGCYEGIKERWHVCKWEEMHAYAFSAIQEKASTKKGEQAFLASPWFIRSDLKWSDIGCRNPSCRHLGIRRLTLAYVLTHPLLDARFQRRHFITSIRDFKTRPKMVRSAFLVTHIYYALRPNKRFPLLTPARTWNESSV